MKLELQQIFDNTPADTPRSRLEPYRELILRWRRQGRTYRKICALLNDSFSLKISYLALYEFVQRRSRPRTLMPEPEIQSLVITHTEGMPAATEPGKRLTPEERAAQVEFIRSLNQPTLQEQQPEKPRWNFDVDKPRTMHKP